MDIRYKQTDTLPEEQCFDYIIVGAGPGGIACAKRLSEYMPEKKIALIEAGGADDEIFPATDMPMMFTSQHFTENDWRYFSSKQSAASDRNIYLPRGKVIGGTSTGNATLLNRGSKEDWDEMAKLNPGWSWDEVTPFFKNVETFHPISLDWEPEMHGKKGPLHFQHPEPVEISFKIIESYESKGLPKVRDFFSVGASHGCDHVPRSVYKGVRTHAGHYIKGENKPDNLTIFLRSQVLRAVIEERSGRKICTGVNVHQTRTNRHFTLHASEEVILSGGAYNTPVILMHSGIGPESELHKHHIPVNVNAQGVGKNLTDHLMVWSFYEVSDSALTNDPGYYPENIKNSEKQWHETRNGPLANFLIGPMAYMKLTEQQLTEIPEWHEMKAALGGKDPTGAPEGSPQIEFFSTEAYGAYEEQLDNPKTGEAAISLTTLLLNQRSKGTVTLSSFHPLAPPHIDHAYLSDPLDVALFAWGCRYADEIMREGKGTKDVIRGAWPRGQHKPTTLEGWKQFVRDNATTCYHPAGTCKMGPAEDPGAVVCTRLKVHGVEGLRIADLSVMPRLSLGHPQHPTYMIGEKAAYMIAEDAGVKVEING